MVNLLRKLRKKMHGDMHARMDNLEEKINIIMKMVCKPEDELSVLCDIYGSDKGSVNNLKLAHTYTTVYHDIFKDIRNNVKSVFECGIGTNNPKLPSTMGIGGRPGASLRVWRDYFKNAIVVGGDIDKDILFEEERIYTDFIDQLKPEVINYFFQSLPDECPKKFDIMIDDGLHTFEANICLFQNAFKYLNQDGLYIIEDVHLDYMQKMQEYLKTCKDSDSISVEYKFLGTQWVGKTKWNAPWKSDSNMVIIQRKKYF